MITQVRGRSTAPSPTRHRWWAGGSADLQSSAVTGAGLQSPFVRAATRLRREMYLALSGQERVDTSKSKILDESLQKKICKV